MRRAIFFTACALLGCEPEPPDLYAPPRERVTFDRIPEPKKPPPPPAPRIPKLGPREAEALFWRILDFRVDLLASCGARGPSECGYHESWLRRALESHELEGRLFARAYPEVVERYAAAILSDPLPDRVEVQVMLDILGELSSRDHPRLEAAIARWVPGPDSTLTFRAMSLLSTRSRLPRHRRLLFERCATGDYYAFGPLTYDAHPETMRFLENLKKTGRVMLHDRNIIPGFCDGALEKMAIHLAPDRWGRVERMLNAGPDGIPGLDYYWATNVAWRENPELFRKVLERQLQEYRKKYGPLLEQDALDDFETYTPLDPRRVRRRFSERFVLFPDLPELPEHFDTLLFWAAGLGGELRPIEIRRLRTFGFVGDPEERLLEILRIRSGEQRPLGRFFLAPLCPVPVTPPGLRACGRSGG